MPRKRPTKKTKTPPPTSRTDRPPPPVHTGKADPNKVCGSEWYAIVGKDKRVVPSGAFKDLRLYSSRVLAEGLCMGGAGERVAKVALVEVY